MNLLMDKNELVNKIRGIEGLTNDEKSALIEMLRKQKKYGLYGKTNQKMWRNVFARSCRC